MSYSRRSFKLINTLFSKNKFFNREIFKPKFPIAPSMTTAYNNQKNLDTLGIINNLMYVVKNLNITNESTIRNELKETTIHCIQGSLDLAKAYLSEYRYSLAGEQASKILESLEKMYGKITTSSAEEIKRIAFEAYKIQGRVYKIGTLDECEIALVAFKNASELEPNNNEIKNEYEGFMLSMGIVPEGQQLEEYSDSYINKMKK